LVSRVKMHNLHFAQAFPQRNPSTRKRLSSNSRMTVIKEIECCLPSLVIAYTLELTKLSDRLTAHCLLPPKAMRTVAVQMLVCRINREKEERTNPWLQTYFLYTCGTTALPATPLSSRKSRPYLHFVFPYLLTGSGEEQNLDAVLHHIMMNDTNRY